MAEALAVVGGVAAITQLAKTLVEISSVLRSCAITMHNAPKDVKQFRLELTNLAGLLRHFQRVCGRWLTGMSASPEKDENERYVAGIIRECKNVAKGFWTLVDRFFGQSSLPITLDWIERYKWYLRKTQVNGLRLGLNAAKGSVSTCTTLVMCEDLMRRIEELERENKVSKELQEESRAMELQLREQVAASQTAHIELLKYVNSLSHAEESLIPVRSIRKVALENLGRERNVTDMLKHEPIHTEGRPLSAPKSAPSHVRGTWRRTSPKNWDWVPEIPKRNSGAIIQQNPFTTEQERPDSSSSGYTTSSYFSSGCSSCQGALTRRRTARSARSKGSGMRQTTTKSNSQTPTPGSPQSQPSAHRPASRVVSQVQKSHTKRYPKLNPPKMKDPPPKQVPSLRSIPQNSEPSTIKFRNGDIATTNKQGFYHWQSRNQTPPSATSSKGQSPSQPNPTDKPTSRPSPSPSENQGSFVTRDKHTWYKVDDPAPILAEYDYEDGKFTARRTRLNKPKRWTDNPTRDDEFPQWRYDAENGISRVRGTSP